MVSARIRPTEGCDTLFFKQSHHRVVASFCWVEIGAKMVLQPHVVHLYIKVQHNKKVPQRLLQ